MKYKVGDKVVILNGKVGTVLNADDIDKTYLVRFEPSEGIRTDKWWFAEDWLKSTGVKECGVHFVPKTSACVPKRIYKGKGKLVVLWTDGTKTVVKRAEGEPDSDYAAFTAALAIKIYGSNSAVNRIVRKVELVEKKKKKRAEEPKKEVQVMKIGFTISPENITVSREEV